MEARDDPLKTHDRLDVHMHRTQLKSQRLTSRTFTPRAWWMSSNVIHWLGFDNGWGFVACWIVCDLPRRRGWFVVYFKLSSISFIIVVQIDSKYLLLFPVFICVPNAFYRSAPSKRRSPHWPLFTFFSLHMFVANSIGPVESVISSIVSPGRCWAMEGSEGRVSIQLAREIGITSFSMEHTLRSSAAPREFEVDVSSHLGANMVYTLNSIQIKIRFQKG